MSAHLGSNGSTPPISVLVTGAGGPLGVSIVKALRMSPLHPRVVATDADPHSIGLYRADAGYVLPHILADRERYVCDLESIICSEHISLVCFGSEIEMEGVAPSRDQVERETGARLVVERPEVLQTITDKFDMVDLLRRRALPVPDSALAADRVGTQELLERHGFPVIIKPRHGSGSRQVIRADNQRELDALCGYIDDAVVQEYLGPAEEEYTVGLYKGRSFGYVGQISLRRELVSGNTYKAEVVEDAEIELVSRAFAERIDASGPINLQLFKTHEGVRIFEVNLRFSGSAVMRAWFGFNEPEIAIHDLVLHTLPPLTPIRHGYAFRYWEEVYMTPDQVGEGPPANPHEAAVGERLDLL